MEHSRSFAVIRVCKDFIRVYKAIIRVYLTDIFFVKLPSADCTT